MKVTFKTYDEMKDILENKSSVTTSYPEAKWDKTIYIKDGYDNSLDTILKNIAEKEYKVTDFQLIIINGQKRLIGRIALNNFNSNVNPSIAWGVTQYFDFTDELCSNVDFEGEEYYVCRICGLQLDPESKNPFDFKSKFKDMNTEDIVCPACFTQSFDKISSL
jgi:rubredoxin